jgi:DNA-binding response OmpR family regulator
MNATILLVEDEPAIRQLIATALTVTGYRVSEARNGKEALDVFDAAEPTIDLLLTDIRLPYMDGRQLIEQLRVRRSALKVLAFSGYAPNPPEDVDFLAKPFSRDVLLGAVRDALSRDE